MTGTKRPGYQDLTAEQIDKIDNGVGPTWVPNKLRSWAERLCNFKVNGKLTPWFPKAAQVEHDFEYTLGGSKFNRHKADVDLLLAMQENCRDFPKGKLWWALFIADTMYILLRFVGHFAYHFVEEGEELRTIDQVLEKASSENKETPLTIGKFIGLLILAAIVLFPIFLLFLIRQFVWIAIFYTKKNVTRTKAVPEQNEA